MKGLLILGLSWKKVPIKDFLNFSGSLFPALLCSDRLKTFIYNYFINFVVVFLGVGSRIHNGHWIIKAIQVGGWGD